jgi:hypothetical protein
MEIQLVHRRDAEDAEKEKTRYSPQRRRGRKGKYMQKVSPETAGRISPNGTDLSPDPDQ